MSFKNLDFKVSYNSDHDDILNDFYVPALSESILYKRIGGYFSSSSFALSARGLSKFIYQGGQMRLLVNYQLQEKDKDMIERINTDPKKFSDILSKDISSWNLENEIVNNHVKAFGWMLANNKLDLKIAITTQPEIFHQKVGIMYDTEGNKVSFSGSNNESSFGWKSNIEQFKVFRGWIDEQNKYLQDDEEMFDRYWNGGAERFRVVDVPTAVREKLVKIAPKNIEDIEIDRGDIYKALFGKSLQQFENEKSKTSIVLHNFQKEAISKWVENGHVGILEMATGTGKTYTALGAAKTIIDEKSELCLVVAVPYKHLAAQWIDDIDKFFPDILSITAHSESPGWSKKVDEFLADYRAGFIKKFIIIISYDTLSTDRFLEIFRKNFSPNRSYMLIADEVHNFGSNKRKNGMVEDIYLRLGLSATPTRWFDEEGTNEIQNYFGKTVFKYDLKMAIDNGFLTHYEYHPMFVKMSEEEMVDYYELTQKINKNYKGDAIIGENKYLKLLLIRRSKILKNIKQKIIKFEELIIEMKSKGGIDHLLIYCDSNEQLDRVQKIINKHGIINHKFTEKESDSDRKIILRSFDEGIYQCLVAIKCLDEGVNVPSTKTAIILASTTNPREYIQRRGRVLRKIVGKEKAIIYDFTVLPPDSTSEENISIEKKIFKSELSRIQEFLATADNKMGILIGISDIMLKYGVYLDK